MAALKRLHAPLAWVHGGWQRDVLLTVDGTALTDGQQLIDLLGTHAPGDVVEFGVRHHDGTEATLSVTLGAPKTTL